MVSVNDLQLCQLNDLVKEFGGPTAQRLKNLASGIDDSPVTPTGAPQVQQETPIFFLKLRLPCGEILQISGAIQKKLRTRC